MKDCTFRFRHQPFRLGFAIYKITSGLLIQLPFLLLRYIFPSQRPHPSWSISRSLYMTFVQKIVAFWGQTRMPPILDAERGCKSAFKAGNGFSFVDPAPADVIVGDILEAANFNHVQSAKVHGYWYSSEALDKSSGRPPLGSKVIYYLHGGAFIFCSAHPSDPVTSTICKGLIKHCADTTVFALEYRLSTSKPFTPQNPFPTAIIDALSGYYYLIHTLSIDPTNIILAGDSAGANIITAMTLYLARHDIPSLPIPHGLILLSPAVDWSTSHIGGPECSMAKGRSLDMVSSLLPPVEYAICAVLGKMPLEEADTNIYISPASLHLQNTAGIFSSFPKVFVVVGGVEMLADSIHTFCNRLISDIGEEKVQIFKGKDCCHNFLGFAPFQLEKEQALDVIGKWLISL